MATRVSISKKQQREMKKKAAAERENPEAYAAKVRSKALHKANRDNEMEVHNGKPFTSPQIKDSAKKYTRKTKHKGQSEYD